MFCAFPCKKLVYKYCWILRPCLGVLIPRFHHFQSRDSNLDIYRSDFQATNARLTYHIHGLQLLRSSSSRTIRLGLGIVLREIFVQCVQKLSQVSANLWDISKDKLQQLPLSASLHPFPSSYTCQKRPISRD
jgi:hypothetical protein